MKINRLTDTLGFLGNGIRRKEDGDATGQDQRRGSDQEAKDQRSFEETLEVTEQRVDDAITRLNQDSQALNHGLTANVEGQGPGMKVVLKDGSGATIRQFTGEEFLKLRQAAGAGTGARGKLLDRKL